jgi:tRNA uridine 5-carbamoylmethylation protein Kti12
MDRQKVEQLSLFMVDIYNQIETDILLNMVDYLKNGVDQNDILAWQGLKMMDIGGFNQANIKIMAKYAKTTESEIKRLLKIAGFEAALQYDGELSELLPEMAIKLGNIYQSNAIIRALNGLEAQAKQTFNLINTTMLDKSREIYLKTLNETVAKVITGTMTKNQALSHVARKWANDGIPAMVDKLGREWSSEAYVNMTMRATIGNTANNMQMARMDDYEVDLVEVSKHEASRPSHVQFQGKIYSRSGQSKRYPHINETGYGTITGIGGINCSHRLYPYVQGKSIKRPVIVDETENKRKYEESQKQRSLERAIRKAKKELMVAEQIGEPTEIQSAKLKVRNKQERMREFISETERTRRYNRERIVTP